MQHNGSSKRCFPGSRGVKHLLDPQTRKDEKVKHRSPSNLKAKAARKVKRGRLAKVS